MYTSMNLKNFQLKIYHGPENRVATHRLKTAAINYVTLLFVTVTLGSVLSTSIHISVVHNCRHGLVKYSFR